MTSRSTLSDTAPVVRLHRSATAFAPPVILQPAGKLFNDPGSRAALNYTGEGRVPARFGQINLLRKVDLWARRRGKSTTSDTGRVTRDPEKAFRNAKNGRG